MKLTHHTGNLKIFIYCCVFFIYIALNQQKGVMSIQTITRTNIRNESVSLGGNITFGVNASNYQMVAWMHNSSQIIVHWDGGKHRVTRPNVKSETPTHITILNAGFNDSGLYTLIVFTNLSSTKYFFLNVNGTDGI
ncbi:membrane protein EE50 [Proboscivirus elephantidbeta5]|uniref:Membrane protein EE50 n=1 Tax=Elephant endotheliotropic herpesvirus 5 TaxID=768738 RepID=A0A075CZR9_9BETA|nr:membrane protein EE50 [Elephant endotheliotropic herpesvirus 5]AHC02809.1 membrane protein EE50 [Elephant endotheliotropic herpesvirus 5]